MIRTIIALCTSVSLSVAAYAHSDYSAQTTYLGNEGIMVSDQHTTVLFDPLFPNGFDVYQLVPTEMRSALMAGAAPYDDVDAIFVSHMHPDHFSVDEVIAYLEQHDHVRLYAPSQAIEWMHEETDNQAIFDRVTGVSLERLDDPVSFREGDLTIDAVRIPHAGWPARADISNLVWRVTLADGVTVMHLGDADPDDSHYAPHTAHWQAKRADAAYPPYWFFLSEAGRHIVEQRLNTETATGIHVPVDLPADLFISGADFLHEPGETRSIKAGSEE